MRPTVLMWKEWEIALIHLIGHLSYTRFVSYLTCKQLNRIPFSHAKDTHTHTPCINRSRTFYTRSLYRKRRERKKTLKILNCIHKCERTLFIQTLRILSTAAETSNWFFCFWLYQRSSATPFRCMFSYFIDVFIVALYANKSLNMAYLSLSFNQLDIFIWMACELVVEMTDPWDALDVAQTVNLAWKNSKFIDYFESLNSNRVTRN